MKIQIKSLAGSVLFEGDFECISKAVESATKSKADLRYADLSSADLSYTDLSYTDLSSADLSYTDLRYTNLRSTNLRSANLRSANLRSANLSYTNLSSTNLSYTNLSYTDLRYANLRYADLSSANLSSAKADFFDVLIRSKKEIEGLRKAIVEGRINGSSYEGDCACLVGTIANVARCNYDQLANLKPDSNRPSERLFLAIKTGDMPETNPVSKIVLEWLDEFTALLNA